MIKYEFASVKSASFSNLPAHFYLRFSNHLWLQPGQELQQDRDYYFLNNHFIIMISHLNCGCLSEQAVTGLPRVLVP